MRDRYGLLEQLDSENAGLGDGARQLIELSRTKPVAPFNSIVGLVADIIEVEVHLAPLIDVGLSHLSEAVVLNDGQIVDLLQQKKLRINGRATLLRLDRLPSRRTGDRIQLDGLRGVIGRADRLIHADDAHQQLVQFLLGTTWLVDSLQTAIDLSHYRGSGLRFVTADCERIDTDGTIQIGSLQTLSGIVTRRSEMQAVREEEDRLSRSIQESAREVAALQEALQVAIDLESNSDQELRKEQLAFEQHKFELQAAQQSLQSAEHQLVQLRSDITKRQSSLSELQDQHAQLMIDHEGRVGILQDLEARISERREEWKRLQETKLAAMNVLSHEKLEAAKFDHRLASEQEILRSLVLDCDERAQLANQAQQRHVELLQKLDSTQKSIQANSEELDAVKIELSKQFSNLETTDQQLNEAKIQSLEAQKSLQEATSNFTKLGQRQDELVNAIAQANQRREMLLQHYRDDYQIDLTTPITVEDQDGFNRESASKEIIELRNEIAAVGSVNMEALAELDSLQTRYDTLHAHYVDLESARESLLKIIERIENKSKEMFMSTLEAIRTNFQSLYRRSFGGGSADIILEDPEDVLNCGVEVVATPPGKIALSNSLLSGGEKALTAVALIMQSSNLGHRHSAFLTK